MRRPSDSTMVNNRSRKRRLLWAVLMGVYLLGPFRGCWPPAINWSGYVVRATILGEQGQLLPNIAVNVAVRDEEGLIAENRFSNTENYIYYAEPAGEFEMRVTMDTDAALLGSPRGLSSPPTPRQVQVIVDWKDGSQEFVVDLTDGMVTQPTRLEYDIAVGTLTASDDGQIRINIEARGYGGEVER